MGRPRRHILSYRVYEICMRTRKGLPFTCTDYMKAILESILARVQRDHKVIICHFLWMRNHPHIIIVAKDSAKCCRFYGEVKKQLTDAIKSLLGENDLSLWKKNGTSVVQYGDVEGLKKQIAYIYANPAKANLIDTISSYQGLSTFESFNKTPNTLSGSYSKKCPWIRANSIEKLPCRSVTKTQDRHITSKLLESATRSHTLTIYPNAWMKCFGLLDEDVAGINQQILDLLKNYEAEAKYKRDQKGQKVMGAKRLALEPLTLSYRAKSLTKKIFCYAASKEIRIEMIKAYKQFCTRCKECYQRWKIGDYRVEWPPGAFLPCMPPRYNWLPE